MNRTVLTKVLTNQGVYLGHFRFTGGFAAKTHTTKWDPNKKKPKEIAGLVFETPNTKSQWMHVRYKKCSPNEMEILKYANDESYRTDPAEARSVSDMKLESLKHSLSMKG